MKVVVDIFIIPFLSELFFVQNKKKIKHLKCDSCNAEGKIEATQYQHPIYEHEVVIAVKVY